MLIILVLQDHQFTENRLISEILENIYFPQDKNYIKIKILKFYLKLIDWIKNNKKNLNTLKFRWFSEQRKHQFIKLQSAAFFVSLGVHTLNVTCEIYIYGTTGSGIFLKDRHVNFFKTTFLSVYLILITKPY